jgi:hypothetical protein
MRKELWDGLWSGWTARLATGWEFARARRLFVHLCTCPGAESAAAIEQTDGDAGSKVVEAAAASIHDTRVSSSPRARVSRAKGEKRLANKCRPTSPLSLF